MNSLVIVADASRARLFRTAATTVADSPVELIEVDSLQLSDELDHGSRSDVEAERADARSPCVETLPRFANRIAIRAAHFARYHFSNPCLVVSEEPVSAAIVGELGQELPSAHVRRITADVAQLCPRELMRELQARDAFSPLTARTPGTIEL